MGKLKRLKVKAIEEREKQSYNHTTIKEVLLNCTNLDGNNNKFYKLELRKVKEGYTVWCHYARVPDSEYSLSFSGQKCNRWYETRDLGSDAKAYAELEYEKLLSEKLKKGYVEVKLGNPLDEKQKQKTATPSQTSLPEDVASLVSLVHEEANSSVTQVVKTPLGAISLTQIRSGQEQLDLLKRSIQVRDNNLIEKYTNAFYSIVPHTFPRKINKSELLLNTPDKIEAEQDLLQVMEDIYTIRNDSSHDSYKALHTDISVSSQDTFNELKMLILASISRSHRVNFEIIRAYDVSLHNEPYFNSKVGNNKLLFHGTRNSNLLGLLSTGFKINPVGVPTNGKMFGDGIYLADKSTKSLQYCGAGGSWTRKENRSKYSHLLIVEAALGRQYEVYSSRYFSEPPTGYHSVWAKTGQSLRHDEFIVYRLSQLRIKHIVQVDATW